MFQEVNCNRVELCHAGTSEVPPRISTHWGMRTTACTMAGTAYSILMSMSANRPAVGG